MLKYAIGQSVPRTEDPRLLRGKGCYVDDFNMINQAYAFMLRSPHAHAEIKSIDASAALAMPGVLTVLTGADYEADSLGYVTGGSPHKRRDGSPCFRPPRPAITGDRVRHVGQIVAVVVAESIHIARDAAEAVEVDYETLPANIDTATASKPGTPAIWDECPDNESFFREFGNKAATDAALAGAAHVFRQRFVINRINANTMEPRGALAAYDTGEGKFTIHTGVQRPYAWRATLSKHLFRIPENRMHFITGDMGGSFGMKGSLYVEVPLVAWAAKRLDRPVKWRCDRSEGFVADDHARDNVSDVQFALDKDGRFLALKVETAAALGAYVSYNGFGPPTNNIGGLAGVYTIPAIYAGISGVFTNTTPTSPYRGAGRPEASYIIERMIHIAAREMGIDPTELRRRNFIPPDAMPYKTALTFTYDCGEFENLMNKTLEKADYKGFEARRTESAANGKLRGIGVSCTIEQAAGPSTETAELAVRSVRHGNHPRRVDAARPGARDHLSSNSCARSSASTPTIYASWRVIRKRCPSAPAPAGRARRTIGDVRRPARHREGNREGAQDRSAYARSAGTGHRARRRQVHHRRYGPVGRLQASRRRQPSLPKSFPTGWSPAFSKSLPTARPRLTFPNGCHVCEVEIDAGDRRARNPALHGDRRLRRRTEPAPGQGSGSRRHRPGRRTGDDGRYRLRVRQRTAYHRLVHGLHHAASG